MQGYYERFKWIRKTHLNTYLYFLNFLFHSFKAGWIMLYNSLLYFNIHFFLFDNGISIARVETTERCDFLLGKDKFPSFIFKKSSNIAFNSPCVAFFISSILNRSPRWSISRKLMCFSIWDWGSITITSDPTIPLWINCLLSCPPILWTPFRYWLRFIRPGRWQIGHVRGVLLGIFYQCYLYQVKTTLITSIFGDNIYR